MSVDSRIKMTGIGTGNHPNTLKGLVPIKNTEMARQYQAASVVSRKLNFEKVEDFRLNAKVLKKYMEDLPGTTGAEVIRLAMHMALDKEDYATAAQYASQLMEYEQPKLARVESTVTQRTSDLSDADLKRIAKDEGLDIG
jgi:hypothetical protein